MNNCKVANGRSHNGRFGVMAAVTPQKQQCKFASLYPAATVVGAATTPSRWDVICHPRTAHRKLTDEQQ